MGFKKTPGTCWQTKDTDFSRRTSQYVQACQVTHNTPQIPAYRDIPFVRLKNETDPTSSILYRKKNLMTREASPLCSFPCNTKVANSRTDGFNKGSTAWNNNSNKTSGRSSFVQPTATAFKQRSDSDTASAMAHARAWFSVSSLYVGSTVDKLTMGWFCPGRLRFSPRSESVHHCSLASAHCLSGGTQVDAWCKYSLHQYISES